MDKKDYKKSITKKAILYILTLFPYIQILPVFGESHIL